MLTAKHWRPEFVLRLLAVLLFCFGVGGMIAALLAAAARDRGETVPPLVNLLLSHLSFQVAGVVAIHLFLRWHGRTWREGFGLLALAPSRAIIAGFGLAMVMLPIGYSLQWLSARGLTLIGVRAEPQSTVQTLVESTTWPVRLYLAVFVVVAAPVVEECLFRGILLAVFRDAGWPRLGFYGTSVVFGVMHGNLAAFLPLTVFGMLLAWLYQRTGSLLAPLSAHAFFNLTSFILVLVGAGAGEPT